MANRAYLYSTNAIEEPLSSVFERDYCDSRHVIPIAWFFFFHPSSLVATQVQEWKEFLFVRDRIDAIQYFTQRMPRLMEVIGGRVDETRLLHLVQQVAAWPEPLLVMNPDEILGMISNNDQIDHERFVKILLGVEGIKDGSASDLFSLVNAYAFLGSVSAPDPEESITGGCYNKPKFS